MVKGYTWRDFAQYNTYGTGSRAGGYVKPDEARICIEECDVRLSDRQRGGPHQTPHGGGNQDCVPAGPLSRCQETERE
jgi:hypothetical protein